MAKKKITVAAIQFEAAPLEIERNRARAMALAREAAGRGADLIVLPELFDVGYAANRSFWAECRRQGSAGLDWVLAAAAETGACLGAGLAEFIDGDFFNTYVVADPSGRLLGRVFKERPEAYVFAPGPAGHTVETPLGRIGVLICADGHYSDLVGSLEPPDLLVAPHAWPVPFAAGGAVKPADVAAAQADMRAMPGNWARMVGSPVVFVNQVGRMASMDGLLGRLMDPSRFALIGLSRIADGAGETLASLGPEDGIASAAVQPGPVGPSLPVPDFDGWVHPGSRLLRKTLLPLDEALGHSSYRRGVRAFRRG